jgi:diadenosine tetraphosphate (Ap4A) HIT family hydrolase
LIIPKKRIKNLLALNEYGDDFSSKFMADLISCVRQLVEDFALENSGYRLIVNGGSYQDFPWLHFHLVSGLAVK